MNTGYIIEIKFEANGELPDYSLDFYAERGGGVISYRYDELVKINTEDGLRVFALVDSNLLGHGHLMCRVTFNDKEPLWNGRPEVFTLFTGVTIGECVCKGTTTRRCGYKFSFSCVDDIPKDIDARVYIGVIKEWITDFKHIKEDMLGGLTEFPVGTVDRFSLSVEAGDRIIVLVPCNEFLTPLKDDGFGGKMPFNTSVLGSNGDVVVKRGEVNYYAYGELMTVGGEVGIFVV